MVGPVRDFYDRLTRSEAWRKDFQGGDGFACPQCVNEATCTCTGSEAPSPSLETKCHKHKLFRARAKDGFERLTKHCDEVHPGWNQSGSGDAGGSNGNATADMAQLSLNTAPSASASGNGAGKRPSEDQHPARAAARVTKVNNVLFEPGRARYIKPVDRDLNIGGPGRSFQFKYADTYMMEPYRPDYTGNSSEAKEKYWVCDRAFPDQAFFPPSPILNDEAWPALLQRRCTTAFGRSLEGNELSPAGRQRELKGLVDFFGVDPALSQDEQVHAVNQFPTVTLRTCCDMHGSTIMRGVKPGSYVVSWLFAFFNPEPTPPSIAQTGLNPFNFDCADHQRFAKDTNDPNSVKYYVVGEVNGMWNGFHEEYTMPNIPQLFHHATFTAEVQGQEASKTTRELRWVDTERMATEAKAGPGLGGGWRRFDHQKDLVIEGSTPKSVDFTWSGDTAYWKSGWRFGGVSLSPLDALVEEW